MQQSIETSSTSQGHTRFWILFLLAILAGALIVFAVFVLAGPTSAGLALLGHLAIALASGLR